MPIPKTPFGGNSMSSAGRMEKMKTIGNVLHQMTDARSILNDLREILRKIDPEFLKEEVEFLTATAEMERDIGDSITPTTSEYLAAREEEMAMELIYIAWQGFQLNKDIFDNPVNALMLHGDFEDLYRKRRLHTLPMAKKARKIQDAYVEELKKLGDEKWAYEDAVIRFYTYLQTTGYKVAHYFGFRLADFFLPYVIPGYTSDAVNTIQYSGELRRGLNIDIDGLE